MVVLARTREAHTRAALALPAPADSSEAAPAASSEVTKSQGSGVSAQKQRRVIIPRGLANNMIFGNNGDTRIINTTYADAFIVLKARLDSAHRVKDALIAGGDFTDDLFEKKNEFKLIQKLTATLDKDGNPWIPPEIAEPYVRQQTLNDEELVKAAKPKFRVGETLVADATVEASTKNR